VEVAVVVIMLRPDRIAVVIVAVDGVEAVNARLDEARPGEGMVVVNRVEGCDVGIRLVMPVAWRFERPVTSAATRRGSGVSFGHGNCLRAESVGP